MGYIRLLYVLLDSALYPFPTPVSNEQPNVQTVSLNHGILIRTSQPQVRSTET